MLGACWLPYWQFTASYLLTLSLMEWQGLESRRAPAACLASSGSSWHPWQSPRDGRGWKKCDSRKCPSPLLWLLVLGTICPLQPSLMGSRAHTYLLLAVAKERDSEATLQHSHSPASLGGVHHPCPPFGLGEWKVQLTVWRPLGAESLQREF